MVAESHLSLNPLTMVYKPHTKITAVCYTNNNVIFHVNVNTNIFLNIFDEQPMINILNIVAMNIICILRIL